MANTAYVRDAKPAEFEDAAIVYARAFVTDPFFNWAGSVREQTKLAPGQVISIETLHLLPKHIRTLFHFHHSMILSTRIVGGRILVTVRPEENGKEKLCSVTLWLPPRTHISGVVAVARSKQYRTLFGTVRNPGGWGMAGFKKLAISYESRMEKLQKRLLKSKGLDYKKAWHVLDVATDPSEEGKGYGGKVLRYGLSELVGNDPAYLESTTPRSRGLYSHLGFEITDEPYFGVKEVNALGLAPPKDQKETATGILVWTMAYKKSDP